jgi:hypothetical protein
MTASGNGESAKLPQNSILREGGSECQSKKRICFASSGAACGRAGQFGCQGGLGWGKYPMRGGSPFKDSSMNLILAVIWLVVGLGILLLPVLDPMHRVVNLGRVDSSIGWIALVFCCYNVVRWWSTRYYYNDQRIIRSARARRAKEEEERPRAEQPPDPKFDFTDKPPPG